MTLLLTDEEVRQVARMPAIIDPVHEALMVEARGGVQSVPRINFGLAEGFLRFMPAVIEESDMMGFKVFDAKFPVARYLIAVFRPSTGELECLVDAAYLTALRTGATTGVATRLMTAPDACREVGVIGSGLEARTNLEAVRAGRDEHRLQRAGGARGGWLRPDAHLNTIGATAPNLREVDPDTFARASTVVIDTEHAGAECGTSWPPRTPAHGRPSAS